MSANIELVALTGIPLVKAGDDLSALICAAIKADAIVPRKGDVFVIAQKIVSKAENRFVDLRSVVPSSKALDLAREVDKDPRLVEVILAEAHAVLRARRGVLIVVDRRGFIVANAGVDQSNTAPGEQTALLLPEDCDASAQHIRDNLMRSFHADVAVIINDSFGRSWRRGTVGVALGAAGLPALRDLRGKADLFGRLLQTTEIGFADEIAAAASLLMGQAAEARPVVLVRGLTWAEPVAPASVLIRPAHEDLFR
ncbi:MAG: coenzyme F420-0:L-glutamate ligase [Rhodospirillaceae bacterium]|nr:coenzyme F420-0:L-glutamate ligase [Rhodospirillaceae bacterium]